MMNTTTISTTSSPPATIPNFKLISGKFKKAWNPRSSTLLIRDMYRQFLLGGGAFRKSDQLSSFDRIFLHSKHTLYKDNAQEAMYNEIYY